MIAALGNITRRSALKLSASIVGTTALGASTAFPAGQSAIDICIAAHQAATKEMKSAKSQYLVAQKALTQAKRYRPLFKAQ